MANKLYKKLIKQYSEDGGITWYDVVPESFKVGDLLEDPSNCKTEDQKNCRWVEYKIEDSWLCDGKDKYYKEYEECTEDGKVWKKTGLEKRGKLFEKNSSDCEGGFADGDFVFEYVGQTPGCFINGKMKSLNGNHPSATYMKNINISHVVTFRGGINTATIGLTKLIKLPDTQYVTDMCWLFSNSSQKDYNLTELDFTKVNINTSNVALMCNMFSYNKRLLKLDVSTFDTRNVTDMSNMFDHCISLKEINLKNWETKNLEKITNIFNGCSSLTNLDLSNFDTYHLEETSDAFYFCENLITIDLSNWNLVNDRTNDEKSQMFDGCTSLKTIYMRGCSNYTISRIQKRLDTSLPQGQVTIVR